MTAGQVTRRGREARPTKDALSLGLRLVGAVALLVGGYEHLVLYRQGYRSIPIIGPLFLVNVVGSTAVGVTLLVRRGQLVRLGGLAIAIVTLIFFALSRTSGGVFGFAESGLEPQPHAAITLVAEVVAVSALIASLAVARR
jgi:hypothetical protein